MERNQDIVENFYMPAEWEKQEAIWISWPYKKSIWLDNLRIIQNNYAEVISHISKYNNVCLICLKSQKKKIIKLLNDHSADNSVINFYYKKMDDSWTRDTCPTFLKNKKDNSIAIVDWNFNSWGNKFSPWNLDNSLPAFIEKKLKIQRFQAPIICEGGAIESNGKNLILTTECVLLNKNRNPEFSKIEIDKIISQHTGIRNVVWLKNGLIGDDTDGHIDNIARFFKTDGLLLSITNSSNNPNYTHIKNNYEILKKSEEIKNNKIEIIELPLPEPIFHKKSPFEIIPANYANFLIVNDAVIIPAFNQKKNDDRASAIIRNCFPDRKIIPINCINMIQEGGAIHCITQQQPKV